jgi:predicted phage tail protein
MFITLKLKGALGKKFGYIHKCIASNVNQAIRYLEVNFPEFREWILSASKRGIVFNVKSNSYELEEVELLDPIPEDGTVTITPTFVATGGGMGWLKIVLGVGLLGLGLFGVAILGLAPLQMIVVGSLLLISGLIGKKTPKDDTGSLVFSGPTNTAEVGGRVPVVYGVILTGSVVLSAGIRSFIVV